MPVHAAALAQAACICLDEHQRLETSLETRRRLFRTERPGIFLTRAGRRRRGGRCRPRRDSCRSAPRSARAGSCRDWRAGGRADRDVDRTRSRARSRPSSPTVTSAVPRTTTQCSARCMCFCSDSRPPGFTTMRLTWKRVAVVDASRNSPRAGAAAAVLGGLAARLCLQPVDQLPCTSSTRCAAAHQHGVGRRHHHQVLDRRPRRSARSSECDEAALRVRRSRTGPRGIAGGVACRRSSQTASQLPMSDQPERAGTTAARVGLLHHRVVDRFLRRRARRPRASSAHEAEIGAGARGRGLRPPRRCRGSNRASSSSNSVGAEHEVAGVPQIAVRRRSASRRRGVRLLDEGLDGVHAVDRERGAAADIAVAGLRRGRADAEGDDAPGGGGCAAARTASRYSASSRIT